MGAVIGLFWALQQEPALAVVSVKAHADPRKVIVVYSLPVDPSTSQRPESYSIAPAVKVESALRSLDLRTVTLSTGELSEGVAYTLTVAGVLDCASPPHPVPPGTSSPFSFSRGLFGASTPKEGSRVLPKLRQPASFHTPEADAVLAALQVFPRNNPWNEDISKRPLHPDSERLVASIGRDKPIRVLKDMAYVVVPPDQPRVDVKISSPEESDKGPFPVPGSAPIEGWPMDGRTLEEAQTKGGADRHMIVVDAHAGMLYEFYQAFKRPGGWEASGEATFDLKNNRMRPRTWTSSDAAGLPIFPSLPRFDECERGKVGHALRFTAQRTRRDFIYPARHQAGRSDAPDVPAMGQRFRLKAGVDVSGFPKHARAIAEALKTYGMLLADNGGDWDLCTPPDPRLKGLEALQKLKGSDFEAVLTTGESELGR